MTTVRMMATTPRTMSPGAPMLPSRERTRVGDGVEKDARASHSSRETRTRSRVRDPARGVYARGMKMYRWPSKKPHRQIRHGAPFVDRSPGFHGARELVVLGEREHTSQWYYRVVFENGEVASTLAHLRDEEMLDAIEHALVSRARFQKQPVSVAKAIASLARAFVREGTKTKAKSGR